MFDFIGRRWKDVGKMLEGEAVLQCRPGLSLG